MKATIGRFLSLLACFALGIGSAFAAEVTFTGAANASLYVGETEPWRNLCNPANYDGGALPTSDDVIVYDVTTTRTGGGTLSPQPYLSGSLAVKGLIVKNYSGIFWIHDMTGYGLLTLGSEGISLVNCAAFTLNCPTATAEDQTWKADNGARLEFNKTITGSGQTLTFGKGDTTDGTITFHEAPNYDGTMVFAIGNRVSYRKNGKWANAIRYSGSINANSQVILFEPHEDLDWDVIFPEKKNYSWAEDYIRMFAVGYNTGNDPRGDNAIPPYDYIGKYKLRVSDVTYTTSISGMAIPASGILELTGDSYWKNGTVYSFIGAGSLGMPTRRDGFAKFILDGNATLDSYLVDVGYWGRWGEGGERVLDQRGGTLKVSGVNVGGSRNNSNDAKTFPVSNPSPWNEYVLSGGTLAATDTRPSDWADWSAHQNGQVNRGLGLCSQEQQAVTGDARKPTSAGVFTMTGGTANVGGIHFGAYRQGWWGTVGGAPFGIGDGFGAFYLGGGTVNLGKDGFYLGTGWNGTDADESNSVYRVSLGGGVLATVDAQTNALAVCFPPTGNAAEINAAKDFRQLGPVHGSGTLRKTGAGTLSLADASRFTGTLEVNEGVVAVDYAPGGGDAASVDSDCICFRADSLAALGDGAAVKSWASTDGSLTAGPTTLSGFLAPTYKADAFNGHGGVLYYTNLVNDVWQGCALEIAKDANPLVGSEEHTIVVVFRPDNFNANSTAIGNGNPDLETGSVGNQVFWSQGIVGNFAETKSGVGLSLMINGRPTLYEGFHDTSLYCGIGYRVAGRKNVCEKGKVSVAIGTMKGSRFTLDVDGEEWTEEYAEVRSQVDSGVTFKRFYSDDQKTAYPLPLYLGTTGSGGKGYDSAFRGTIAEIRIYPSRALDALERKSLALALLARYDEATEARQAAYRDLMASGSLPGAFAAAAVPALPEGATAFDAAALAASGTVAAGSPTTVANEVNGRSVLRFSGEDALTLPADATPVAGQSAFTAAVVFKTTTEGSGENGYAIGSGLVSTWQGGANLPDYAISFRRFGAVGAGAGDATGEQFCNDVKPARLDDGLPHVAVFSVDPTAKTLNVMTDGRLTSRPFFATATSFAARGSYATTIGALNAASGDKAGFFTGDVAEVVFYARALGEDEMTQLSASLAGKYAFRLLDREAHETVESTGFAAKGISVAEGAALRLPLNATSPVTLGTGGTLAVAGTVTGSVRLGAGAVYDAVATTGEIEDLQFAGGTFLASKTSVATVGSRMSGTVKLVLEGDWPDGKTPTRYVFATFDDYEDVKDVVWTSDSSRFRCVIVDRAKRQLVARFVTGFSIIIR